MQMGNANYEDLQELLDLEAAGEVVAWPHGMSGEKSKRLLERRPCGSDAKSGKIPVRSASSDFAGDEIAMDSTNCTLSASSSVLTETQSHMCHFEAFRCPITQQLMREPMVTPSGHSYEGHAIRRIAREMCFSPQTKSRLLEDNLVSNRALADAIEQVECLRLMEAAKLLEETPPRKKPRVLKMGMSSPKNPKGEDLTQAAVRKLKSDAFD